MTVSVPPWQGFPDCYVHPEQSDIKEGDDITLICKSRGAVPTALLEWYNGTSAKLLTTGQQPAITSNIIVLRFDRGKPFRCTAKTEATRILANTPNCSIHFEVPCEQEHLTHAPTVIVHIIRMLYYIGRTSMIGEGIGGHSTTVKTALTM